MAGFDDFWLAYPRKEAKAACVKKWQQKKLDDQAALIVAHVKQRAREDKKWRDGYVPMPLTFINQERWTDEYERIAPKTPPPTAQPEYRAPTPQQCGYEATVNLLLLAAIRRVGGVPDAALPVLLQDKRNLAQRFRDIGHEGVDSAEQRRIIEAAGDWLTGRCRKARQAFEAARGAAEGAGDADPVAA